MADPQPSTAASRSDDQTFFRQPITRKTKAFGQQESFRCGYARRHVPSLQTGLFRHAVSKLCCSPRP